MTRLLLFLLIVPLTLAQQPPKMGDMKVRLNVIDVCAPSEAEQREIAAALSAIPAAPGLAPDFEVARGRTTASGKTADWVRLRRDLVESSLLSNVQYSISVDAQGVVETAVFRWRDPKEVLQVLIEDSVSAGTPAQVIASDTPASRIRVERFGKNSLAVARCANTDQHGLDPLFASASAVMTRYRAALRVRQTVPGELSRLGVGAPQARSIRR